MEPITLIAAGLWCMTIGAKLAAEPTIKSDSYSLSQIKEVAFAMDPNSVVTGIEKLVPVLVNSKEPATLYDLNGDEGYLVLGENYKIFDYRPAVEVIDELPSKEFEFNPINRVFTTHGGEPVSVTKDLQEQQPRNYESISYKEQFIDHGCGKIEENDLTAYVQNKFPGGTLDDEFSLPIRRNTQLELSVYIKEWYENGELHSTTEGNCWLCATYTVFDYLINQSAYSLSSFNSFPKRANTVMYYPRSQEPQTYAWVKTNAPGYEAFEEAYGNRKAKNLNSVYVALRLAGIALKTSSPIDGLSCANNVAIMETVAHNYGLSSFYGSMNTKFNDYVGTQDFKQFLNEDKPLLFSSSGSTYGNHTMIVSGYKYYKRTVKILFWDKIEWATFLEIGDGDSLYRRYFDITRYYWENCGGGTFIKYEF